MFWGVLQCHYVHRHAQAYAQSSQHKVKAQVPKLVPMSKLVEAA